MNRKFLSKAFVNLFMFFPFIAFAQISSIVSRNPDLPNNINVTVSYGEIIEKRNAWFYGFAAEYNRLLNNVPVGLGASIMWDSEKDKSKENPVQTFTASLGGSYLITRRFSLGTGLAKGFIDNNNLQRDYRFTNGDWITGLILGYSIPTSDKTFIGLTSALEYNMSLREFSISLDLSYAFSW